MTTHLGAAGGALGWVVVEWMHRGKPTALGIASGLVAGLVAITPAAGFVAPLGGDRRSALVAAIGLLRRGACRRTASATTTRSTPSASTASAGSRARSSPACSRRSALNDAGANGAALRQPVQLGIQALACAVSGAYALVVTWVILKLIDRTVGLRVDVQDEREGLDAMLHGEEATRCPEERRGCMPSPRTTRR